ncbi:hypothetical protein NM688_g259 [Phlebia brevispora]|uniref:Uncharacterized protein n=1 Tax=Phlebia brevispora TaxID=194682 RepID=A0ACC1TEI6_9APHY|nr:hypothetical protein NM688_g259 [Phlebia brevispora]
MHRLRRLSQFAGWCLFVGRAAMTDRFTPHPDALLDYPSSKLAAQRSLKMANLYEDSWRGTLTTERLKQYLSTVHVDHPGGPKNITPLAAACWQGHLEIVALLLDNPYQLADPNALSLHDRTPLYYATTHSPPTNRAAIVRWLLKAGADPDCCCSHDGLATPLMNAVAVVKDKDVVRELLARGASTVARNARGETPQTLAKGTPLETVVSGKEELGPALVAVVDIVVAIVMLVVAVTNSTRIQGVIDGIITKLSQARNSSNAEALSPQAEVAKVTSEPPSARELVTKMDAYVRDFSLEKFYTPGAEFLCTVADKAVALCNDKSTSLGNPDGLHRLTRLSLYQSVIYCDDSTSMQTGTRYKDQRDIAGWIARIATKLVPSNLGVELRFINSRVASNVNATKIGDVMGGVEPDGSTRLGTGLRTKVLQPLVYDILDHPSLRLQRPLLIHVLIDGQPDSEPMSEFKDAIVECRRRLFNRGYEPTAVMFCVSQIGGDQGARNFLEELEREAEVEDVLCCTIGSLDGVFRELKANERRLEEWLLKTITAPIMQHDEPTASDQAKST